MTIGFAILCGLALAVVVMGLKAMTGAKGPKPPPMQVTDENVQRLIQRGDKIGAIKMFRELHGTDLKTAHDAVSAYAEGKSVEPPTPPPPPGPELDMELRNLKGQGQMIEAIKRYRDATGQGLKESKDYVEAL